MPRDYVGEIRNFEGYDPRAKWDYKQWTNGYGTKARFPGEAIDRDEAQKRFDAELESARGYVRNLGVQLTPGQEAALTDLTYNTGPGWTNSGLGQAVKAGDWDTAKQRFVQYNQAGGAPHPALIKRRNQAVSWFDDTGGENASVQTAQATPAAARGAFVAPPTQGVLREPTKNLGGTVGSALGAFAQGSGDNSERLAAMAKSGREANASMLSEADTAQMNALKQVLARRQLT
jgi:lysozyme